MTSQTKKNLSIIAVAFICVFFSTHLFAADQPQWGQRYINNMISAETNLPDDFDLTTEENIKWIAPLGSETWATPVIANGKVFIGTNNDPPRDPKHKGDRGILLCLDEKDGSLLWQLVVPKLGPDPYLDWPRGGIVSPVTVEGDKVYVVTNRNEVMCLDINGQADGNDGPYTEEGTHMGLKDSTVCEVTKKDADVLWIYDIPSQAGTYPHDAAHSSILIDGDFLYINTSNGVDNTHRKIRAPEAPSLVVLHKKTGTLLARDNQNIGPYIFHSTWSSPAMGTVNGGKVIFFGGGDGVMYAFKAVDCRSENSKVQNLDLVWKFDCDPTAPKEGVHEYIGNRTTSPSNIKGMPVFCNDRIYVAAGGDIWWGKDKAFLKCIEATGTGDVTDSALIWSYELNEHCCSTPAVINGMVFIADCGGFLHCIDEKTGKAFWTHDTEGEIWASPLVADGKVYIGNRKKLLWILAAEGQKKLITKIQLDSPTASTPVAANSTLYITTMHKLYAIDK